MRKQLAIVLPVLVLGIIVSAEIACLHASSHTSICVKDGDWIQYHVSTSGRPPGMKRIVWARMEILDVEESFFKANVIGGSERDTVELRQDL